MLIRRSTMELNHIDFSINSDKQALKLIELPPELLSLLESNSPPALSIISSHVTTNTIRTTQGAALLVYGTQKYKMRSKNSSNTILLFQPSSQDLNLVNSGSKTNSVEAIAQCNETIELVLVDEETEADTAKVKVNKWHEKFAKNREGREN